MALHDGCGDVNSEWELCWLAGLEDSRLSLNLLFAETKVLYLDELYAEKWVLI